MAAVAVLAEVRQAVAVLGAAAAVEMVALVVQVAQVAAQIQVAAQVVTSCIWRFKHSGGRFRRCNYTL